MTPCRLSTGQFLCSICHWLLVSCGRRGELMGDWDFALQLCLQVSHFSCPPCMFSWLHVVVTLQNLKSHAIVMSGMPCNLPQKRRRINTHMENLEWTMGFGKQCLHLANLLSTSQLILLKSLVSPAPKGYCLVTFLWISKEMSYYVIHSHVKWQVKPARSLHDWCRFVQQVLHYRQNIPQSHDHVYVTHSHIVAMEAAMVLLLLKQLLLWWKLLYILPCPTCNPTPHTSLQNPPLPLPLQNPKIERAEVRGYQFTMTQMPNSLAFGGGKVPASFQWPHEMETVLPSLLHFLRGTQWKNIIHFSAM